MATYYPPPPEPKNKDEFNAMEIYTEHMSSAQNGHAMWYAFTREVALQADEIDVQLGDVGYFYKGDFFRFFNAFHEPGHAFNGRGVPEGFRPILVEDKNLNIVSKYIAAGDVLCGGQLKRVDDGVSGHEEDSDILSYTFKASGTGAALIVLDDAHKKGVHRDHLPALQRYFDRNVEAWSEFLLYQCGFVVPERDVALIYGYTKTGRSVHVAVKPRPKAQSKASFTIKIRTARGVHPSTTKPPGWHVECLGGPFTNKNPDLFSRYVFMDYMSKNGIVSQLFRAAKGIFAPSRHNSRDVGDTERDGDQGVSRTQLAAAPSPPRE